MIRITAGPAATASCVVMVYRHIFGDVALEDRVCDPVDPMTLACNLDLTITMLICTFLPFPAPGGVILFDTLQEPQRHALVEYGR